MGLEQFGIYLYAVVTVGVVVHCFELFVDDTDAGFVRPVCHAFNVFCGFAHGLELLVEFLRGFDGGLRVELGCVSKISSATAFNA